MQHIVAMFEDDLGCCCKLILELEQLAQMKDGKAFAESLDCLSNVMCNVHDYLIHVALRVHKSTSSNLSAGNAKFTQSPFPELLAHVHLF